MSLIIEVIARDGSRVLMTNGEVDLSTSPDLRRELMRAIEEGPAVVVDLSKVAYMDSSGVATLVEGLKSSSKKSQKFTLLSPSQPVMNVLKLARLDSIFEISEEA